ncbi:DUF411 domain-containing protein [Microbulbifer elongatus]|uniref:DUF411 domain-containing protein n=1 Tax=Microbulbifer elongatus TaxID=86173 RepID=A0ABT1P2G0_9GAMM|nr:DUF411 domain-containing protein [Microbulbifer elongatus]MCQ3830315.1 DUF411 domain-containing protein [Microbulbifer elongatus]
MSGCTSTTSDTAPPSTTAQAGEQITVYKSPFCLCCNDWITHLESNAFAVTSENGLDTASVKQQWKVPPPMQGCHTGVWNNQYVFEGHVPARLIRKFLANPPKDSIGLAVPGMPQGSPGMYRGKNFEPYVVYAIQSNGEYRFYEKVTAPEAS